jgi:hypothetical protein
MATGTLASPSTVRTGRLSRWLPWFILSFVAGLLLFHSQTYAWYSDEYFHMTAAQLLGAGRRPYLDFFHQHPPFYPGVLALWIWVFGQSWRSAHLLSALLVAGSMVLLVRSVRTLLAGAGWEAFASSAAVLFLGLHSLVPYLGVVSMPYALCFFLTMGAFWCVLNARPFGAGLCAGAALSSSLLTTPLPALLFFWHLRSRPMALRFLAGFALPLAPLAWLFLRDPYAVWFNLVEYHLKHRRYFLDDPTWISNLKVLAWLPLNSQGQLLLALSAGAVIVAYTQQWARRREVYLAACCAVALTVFVSSARPTFSDYLILAIPFWSLLAALGLSAMGRLVSLSPRPVLLAPLLVLYLFGPVRYAVRHRGYITHWRKMEELSREVNRVVPPQAYLYAPDPVYFQTGRLPPAGLNNFFSHRVQVPPDVAARLRIVPQSQLQQWMEEGRFDAAVVWDEDPAVTWLAKRYVQRAVVQDMIIFERTAGAR